MWRVHQDPICFGWFRENLELVWFSMVWFETISIYRFCESFIKISLVLAVLEKIYSWFSLVRFGMVWFGMVWYGMVWYGLRHHPSEATVKILSKSDLFWLGWPQRQSSLALKGLSNQTCFQFSAWHLFVKSDNTGQIKWKICWILYLELWYTYVVCFSSTRLNENRFVVYMSVTSQT